MAQDSPDDSQAQAVWRCVSANQNKIRDLIAELDEAGAQTVVHGDFSLDNILIVESESDDELYVIDWTQPHLSSVTKDLVDLVEWAPANLRSELIETYRRQIDFAHFEEIYANAKVLKDT